MHQYSGMCAFLIGITTTAFAFDVDAYRSEMSSVELRASVTQNDDEFVESGDGQNFGGVKDSAGKIVGVGPVFNLCKDKVSAYVHSLDFDKDYTGQLDAIIKEHGQPSKTEVSRAPFPGMSNVYVTHVSHTWYFRNERISVDFGPETRDGAGALKLNRYASIGYAVKSPCRTTW